MGLIIGALILGGIAGYGSYLQAQATKEAAAQAEASARKQRQLMQEQSPEQANNTTSTLVAKKNDNETTLKGIRSTILANKIKQTTPSLSGNNSLQTEGYKDYLG